MVRGGRDSQRKYMRKWRKKNKTYSRDYMRASRGSRLGVLGRAPQRKVILGVPVQVYLLSRLTKCR